MDGNRIFASPYENGLWYRDDLLTGIVPETERQTSDISLYPNPAQNRVEVVYQGRAENAVSLSHFDILGNRIIRDRPMISSTNGATMSLDLQSIPAGIYFISLRVAGSFLTAKLVKTE